MVVVFMSFTYYATEWRISIRREMNDFDIEANTKAIDSLLNYRDGEIFRQREQWRPRATTARWRATSTPAIRSGPRSRWLNIGQAAIFTVGLTVAMVMSRDRRAQRPHTVGDFVLINALLMQLYDAAQLHRHRLSRDQAGG